MRVNELTEEQVAQYSHFGFLVVLNHSAWKKPSNKIDERINRATLDPLRFFVHEDRHGGGDEEKETGDGAGDQSRVRHRFDAVFARLDQYLR